MMRYQSFSIYQSTVYEVDDRLDEIVQTCKLRSKSYKVSMHVE